MIWRTMQGKCFHLMGVVVGQLITLLGYTGFNRSVPNVGQKKKSETYSISLVKHDITVNFSTYRPNVYSLSARKK